jgi:8-amino-7-oxononanoate synthase
LAVVAGSAAVVRDFEAHSPTRRHNSPPSMAAIVAGIRALTLNRRCGERRRGRLLRNIRRFRKRVTELGRSPAGGRFPVQTIALHSQNEADRVVEALSLAGIRAVIAADPGSRRRALAFVITAAHRPDEIDRAAGVLDVLRPVAVQPAVASHVTYPCYRDRASLFV